MKNWKNIGAVRLKNTALNSHTHYDNIYDFCLSSSGLIYGNKIADDTMLASVWYRDSTGIVPGKYQFLLLDECGIIIPLWKITEAFNCIRDEIETQSFYWRWHYTKNKHCVYRRDPIPGTGGGCSYFGKYYRRPRTTSERREAVNLAVDEDARYYGVKVRSKRSVSNLPNTYDDTPRGDIRNSRNWKHNRKTHWT